MLTRRAGESIHVCLPDGRAFTVKVHQIGVNVCRIAVDAPPDVGLGRSLEQAVGQARAPRVAARRNAAGTMKGEVPDVHARP